MLRISAQVPRFNVEKAQEILRYSPMLMVQGARQVGKSTLLHQAVGSDGHFVNLDDPQMMAFAQSDPRGFVEQEPDRLLVIDEVQRVPELALALKASIDADRRPGRFAVTGSTNLLRMSSISDSLAGRADILNVYPLSQGEIIQRSTPEDWVTWILSGCEEGLDNALFKQEVNAEHVRMAVIAGGYPEPLKRPQRPASTWFSSYITQLSTHDARTLTASREYPLHLQKMLKIFATQGQSELVKAKIARELGISEMALSDYVELAKTMHLLSELPSWGVGFSGRVIRRPKVSLIDSGLASFLSGLTQVKARQVGGFELFGATLESFVANELLKQQTWASESYELYHYRQRNEEVDIVVELADSRVILIEVKSAVNVDARAWRHLDSMMEKLGDRVAAAVLLYLGKEHMQISRPYGKIILTPVASLWAHA